MEETTLTGESLNIVSQNIEKMKELFPELVTEDKIDFKKFKETFDEQTIDLNERYNFTWKGKSDVIKESQKPSKGTLIPYKEESKKWDTTQNLYIEGDNLEVLKLLQKSYYGKIKVIYIDPPYNTGKDFIYSDNYSDNLQNYIEKDEEGFKISSNPESNGRYHTNWLNMMYPRLRLARNLLSDEGVIFISIDDHELNNLKKICDEIFGEENFISNIIPILNPRGSQSSKNIAINHEYILVYGKSSNVKLYGLDLTNQQKKEYKHKDSNGFYREMGLRKRGADSKREDTPNLYFPIYYDMINKEITLTQNKDFIKILPKLSDGTDGRWRWGKKKVEDEKHLLTVRLVNRKNGDKEYDIFTKDYLTSDKLRKPMSLWNEKEINNEIATEMIQELFGSKLFQYTKSIYLINKILKISSKDNDIVLDFFSGSASTAHSVMKLNSEDNQNRKFIMVQLPEVTDEESEANKLGFNNLCEIGKERIRRAGEVILNESPNEEVDIGFKVFKLNSSNLTKWNPDYDNLEESLLSNENNIIPDRTDYDLVYEIMLKYGIDLTVPIEEIDLNGKTIYSIGFGSLLICLEKDITINLVENIIKIKKDFDSDITRVVFKDIGFKSDKDKTNIKETLRVNNIDEFITL